MNNVISLDEYTIKDLIYQISAESVANSWLLEHVSHRGGCRTEVRLHSAKCRPINGPVISAATRPVNLYGGGK